MRSERGQEVAQERPLCGHACFCLPVQPVCSRVAEALQYGLWLCSRLEERFVVIS